MRDAYQHEANLPLDCYSTNFVKYGPGETRFRCDGLIPARSPTVCHMKHFSFIFIPSHLHWYWKVIELLEQERGEKNPKQTLFQLPKGPHIVDLVDLLRQE